MADKVAEELVVRVSAEIKGLQAGMQEAAASVTTANAEMKKSAASMGETEAQAQARIHAMVQQSLADDKARVAASEAITDATRHNIGVQADWSDAAKDAAYQEGKREEAAMAASMATDRESASTEANTAATVENAAAQSELNGTLTKGSVVREYNALVDEILQKRYTYMAGTTSSLAGKMGLMKYIMSPMGLMFIGIAAAVGTLGLAMFKGEEEFTKYNDAMVKTNGYMGLTYDQYQRLATEVSSSTVSVGEARDAILALGQTGQFTGQEIQSIAAGVAAMSHVTGESIDKVVQQFDKLSQNPVKAVVALNEKYHFLTIATYNQITALEEEGNKAKAAEEAGQLMSQQMVSDAQTEVVHEGYVVKAWDAVKHAIGGAWEELKNFGAKKTLTEQLANVNSEIAKVNASLADASHGRVAAAFGGATTNVYRLRAQLSALQQEAQGLRNKMQMEDLVTRFKENAGEATSTYIANHPPKPVKLPVIAHIEGQGGTSAGIDQMFKGVENFKIAQAPPPVDAKAMQAANEQFVKLLFEWDEWQKKHDKSAAASAQWLQQWKSAFSVVGDAFDETVKGVIRGQETWGEGMRKIGESVEQEALASGIRMLTNWVAIQAAKTEAQIAGDQTRVASATAAANESGLVEMASAVKSIAASAWKAAAAVYASVAAIPFVGWIMAPALALAAGATVIGFVRNIASAAGGWDKVPQDQMAMIHKNEMVLPAHLAEGARNTFKRGSSGGTTNHYHVSALDARSMSEALRRNPGALATGLRHAIKMGHR